MAVRKKLSHDQKTRDKIQTSQLINRLTDHIFNKVELSASQVRSIEVLLRKTLPDLQQVTLESGENPIQFAQVGFEPMGESEWLTKHGRGDHSQGRSTH